MRRVDWGKVSESGFPVPDELPLTELTAELTEMLGAPDAEQREGIAVATLTTWLHRGVYDDLLPGLGDGMVTGLLTAGSPVRRGCSAVVLGTCIDRDHAERRLPPEKVLEWGDRIAAWWLIETDADAIARGADAVGALAAHRTCDGPELAVLLDVVGERASGIADNPTADRLALATLRILRRGLVPTDVVEAWLERTGASAASYLRALYLHLSLTADTPPQRADLLLVVVDRLRTLHPELRGTE